MSCTAEEIERITKLNEEHRRCESIETCNPHNCPEPQWEFEGIRGNGPQPAATMQYSGILLLLAGASNVWHDADRAIKMLGARPYQVGAINDIGCYWKPHVHHIFTAHPEWLPGITEWRCCAPHGNLNKPTYHSDYWHPEINHWWAGVGNQVGTSGQLGVKIAICLGYTRIVLCGMPLDFNLPHFFSPYVQQPDKISCHIVNEAWKHAYAKLPTFKQKVRSMSGNTKQLLGEPDEAWLDS